MELFVTFPTIMQENASIWYHYNALQPYVVIASTYTIFLNVMTLF